MPNYIEVIFGIPLNRRYYYAIEEGEEVQVGCRVMVPLRNRKVTGFVVGLAAAVPAGIGEIKKVIKVIDAVPLFNQDIIDLALWVSRLCMCAHGEALQAMLPGAKQEKEPVALADIDEAATPEPAFELAPQQLDAITAILEGTEKNFYLYGVTGSGKTEVYLRVAEAMIRQGRGVIYLVPEISLTHQVVDIFTRRFGNTVAVLHSGLTRPRKLYEWNRILKGEARLVIGARSAVFAPLADLGLIVMDEEHEGSYKSGATPRYHARQVAFYRCKQAGALLIMGSATPSLEAYYQIQNGGLKVLPMPVRLSGGRMPEITIVDMKGESGPLSRTLIREVQRVHGLGRQTILFLNRRGFAYYFHCKTCGYEMKCKHCSVALTFHKAKWKMICHYCGYKTDPLQVCPACQSLDVGYSGFGTEKIEEEIGAIFPGMTVKRIDTDTVRRRHTLQRILSDFRDGKIDILLGTQMVAKGLNFPNVMLVGIVAADSGFQLPDFRAAERTFDLIVQVAGRAGRVIPDSKVYIQTFQPHNPALILASRGEIDTFYKNELAMRADLEFPPFVRLIRMVFRSADKVLLTNTIAAFCRALPQAMQEYCQLLGPVECPLSVIAGNHRWHVIFRTKQLNRVHAYLAASIARFVKPPRVYIEIDVDPVSLL